MLLPVWGAKCTGKTTLALELSKRLPARGKSVLLISAEPYSELSAMFGMNIPEDKSLQAAIRTGNIKDCVIKKDDLFYILANPSNHDCFDDSYSSAQVKTMLELAKSAFDLVIVDCPTEMDSLVSAWALSLGEMVLLCVGGEFQGAVWQKSAERAISAIGNKIIFIGVETAEAFDYEAMYDFLKLRPDYRIPNKKKKSYGKAISRLAEVMI